MSGAGPGAFTGRWDSSGAAIRRRVRHGRGVCQRAGDDGPDLLGRVDRGRIGNVGVARRGADPPTHPGR